MYEAIDDPYCYPGTIVLKNKLGLRKQADLDKFEAEISLQRSTEPLPAGKLTYPHYCAIEHAGCAVTISLLRRRPRQL
jgi:cell filamentation protein